MAGYQPLRQQGRGFEADAVEGGLAGRCGWIFDGGAAAHAEGEGADAIPHIHVTAGFQVITHSGAHVAEIKLEAAPVAAGSGGDRWGGGQVLTGVDGVGAGKILEVIALTVAVSITQRIGSGAAEGALFVAVGDAVVVRIRRVGGHRDGQRAGRRLATVLIAGFEREGVGSDKAGCWHVSPLAVALQGEGTLAQGCAGGTEEDNVAISIFAGNLPVNRD